MLERGRPEAPPVLVLDDEPDVVESLSDLLRREFRVFGTTDPHEALELLDTQPFVAVVTDQRMADVTGVEILTAAARVQPDATRILITAYSDVAALADAVNRGKLYQYLPKPWDAEELLAVLRSAARHRHLLGERDALLDRIEDLTARFGEVEDRAERLEGERGALLAQNDTLRKAYETLRDSYWHLEKIQEILPICVECGRVRTDRATWTDVAEYLRRHSRFLSHGFCPDCFRARYGEEYDLEEEEDE